MSTGSGESIIENGFFAGIVKGYDFCGFRLEGCLFDEVEFRSCVFDGATIFSSCEILGTVAFAKCVGHEEVQVDDCRLSTAAGYTFARLRGSKLPRDTALELARDIVERALKKFRGPFGFHAITFGSCTLGLPRNNPLSLSVWDILIKHDVVRREPMSGSAEGGFAIGEDPLIRKEIQGLFDNANLGRRLQAAVEELAAHA